ncbi:MAG: tyrosine-type recombinase/integrase [Bacteroides sp.]
MSNGYDINGKQLRSHMTWSPDPGMTEKRISKELIRQATLFEENVKGSTLRNGNIRLVEFTEIFLKNYAYPNLKLRTAFGYEQKMERVNQALGHIKLKELKPAHIASFYGNLQENGMRMGTETATCKIDFRKWMAMHNINPATIDKSSEISSRALKTLARGGTISGKNAIIIANFMGLNPSEVFNISKDMTPLSAGTIQTYHRVLSAVLSKAVKWGYIANNPASNAELPSIAGQEAAYLDEPDARRLLELLKNEPIKWRTIIIFDLLSGIRRGELAGLRWNDIHEETQTIEISQTSNYLPGMGIFPDTPKSHTSKRSLRLSQSAFILLGEYKQWQEEREKRLGDVWKNTDNRIFTTETGTPIFPDSITRWFTNFVKRSGLPKVTLHSLRHTYASLMISDGVDIVSVAHQLGHAQPSTTANIYAHVIAAAEARAAQTFDKFNDVLDIEEPQQNKQNK